MCLHSGIFTGVNLMRQNTVAVARLRSTRHSDGLNNSGSNREVPEGWINDAASLYCPPYVSKLSQ